MFNRCWWDVCAKTIVHVARQGQLRQWEVCFVILWNRDQNVSLKLGRILKKLCSFGLARSCRCIVYRWEAEAEEWETSACSVSFFFKHTLICEGLERALLRMHRSILTLCICGISSACSRMWGGSIFYCLCHLTIAKTSLLSYWVPPFFFLLDTVSEKRST